ncbi:MAG: BREX system Lon protease-like protein BrxL [Fusobacterium gastrosuis]|uniref:BREX system Lon protease-like protein BrxL n=1 Tax=Fusobacterium gastrosuis TaxID=1755100 RepID=UPI002A9A3C31|nr:BREX system Lon protease-like protein BrxL [Fusobacteriaceae bacterium]MDY5794952.1 BREX system Lon protease-like protein BrxL [Fusobacterium gastrosuis]
MKLKKQEKENFLSEVITKDDLDKLEEQGGIIRRQIVGKIDKTSAGSEIFCTMINNSIEEFFIPATSISGISSEIYKKLMEESHIEANITYSIQLQKFSLFDIEILEFTNCIQEYQQMLKDKNISQRIDFILSQFGYDSNRLRGIEKMVFLSRLLPFVEKGIMFYEITKKELGKTTLFKMLDARIATIDANKSSLIYDGRDRKVKTLAENISVLVIDEAHKYLGDELKNAFQIIIDAGFIEVGGYKYKIDTSLVLLGNTKENIGTTNSFFDVGEAFLSRMTTCPPSYGCRTFSKDFLTSNKKDNFEIAFFKKLFMELKETEVNAEEVLRYLGISITQVHSSIRGQKAIMKNFAALLKLIYPEILESEQLKTSIPTLGRELYILLSIAIEFRKNIDIQLKKTNPQNTDRSQQISIERKVILDNSIINWIITPHRVFTFSQGNIIKRAIDTIGEKMNRHEYDLLEKIGIDAEYNQEVLVHRLLSLNELNYRVSQKFYVYNNKKYMVYKDKYDNYIDSRTNIFQNYLEVVHIPEIQGYFSLSDISYQDIVDNLEKKDIDFNYITGEKEILNLDIRLIQLIEENIFYKKNGL